MAVQWCDNGRATGGVVMTKIEWTWLPGYKGETWNPWTGCTKIRPGCKHCYAERDMKRWGLQDDFNKVIIHRDRFDRPLRWKKPRCVFVNSTSDTFHEDVKFRYIGDIFSVIKQTSQHIYQILTKRPERMLEWKNDISRGGWRHRFIGEFPSNVWLGVSVENQDYISTIDDLRKINAAVKFISFEPLIGSIENLNLVGIGWTIIGGESGPNARPMNLEWMRSIISQCREADVPVFVKQMGSAWAQANGFPGKGGDMSKWNEEFRVREYPKV